MWDKLATLVSTTDYWTYDKPACNYRDGRQSLKLVHNNLLQPNNFDHISDKAERLLISSTYHCKNKNWYFERYFTVHEEHHQILHKL